MKPYSSVSTKTVVGELVCLKTVLVVAVCWKFKDVLLRRTLEDSCSLLRETKHFMNMLNGSYLFPLSVFCPLLKDSQIRRLCCAN